MPKALWIEVPVVLAYLLGMAFLRPRIASRPLRLAFTVLGVLIALFVLLQIVAVVLLYFFPPKINIGPF